MDGHSELQINLPPAEVGEERYDRMNTASSSSYSNSHEDERKEDATSPTSSWGKLRSSSKRPPFWLVLVILFQVQVLYSLNTGKKR